MIVVKEIEHLAEPLQDLVKEFRKVQVSRFPLEAVGSPNGNTLGFVDSRYPTDIFGYQKMAGVIHYATDRNGEWYFEIESRLIENPKYGSYNSQKYTRKSKDPKKILKLMRETIKPFMGHEIGAQTRRNLEEKFREWRQEPAKEFRDTVGVYIDAEAIMKEVEHMASIGYLPKTDYFKKALGSGIATWKEKLLRENKKLAAVHVLINPDDSVELSNNSQTFGKDSLDKCSEHVQQAVAMLRIMNVGDFVPEMGYKVSANAYWVEVPTNKELSEL